MPWTHTGVCRSCGAAIVFVRTTAGRWMPVEAASLPPEETAEGLPPGALSHFATCPQAERWRHDRKGG